MRYEKAPFLALYLTYDQWKEEHDSLHARLKELYRSMRWNPDNRENSDWDLQHRKLRQAFIPFMQEWQTHVQQERATVYPFAKAATCGGRIGPVAVLEEEDRIVQQYYEDYARACADGAAPEEALSRLMQVLLTVADYFRMEDETVLPITEKLMEEIAYSGS